MESYSIAWTESGKEHVEGSFDDGDAAANAARESANRVQVPVRVLRQDGTTLMTIRPEAPTLVSVRRPRV
jgi:hypothetical protein